MSQSVIFISYSHQDEENKNQLLAHLSVLHDVKVWSEDKIGPGSDWEKEITNAMAQAHIAVLLITANYLTSNLIKEKQIPVLLKRRQNEGMTVVPLIARPCAWDKIDWLRTLSVRPKNGRPVWSDGGSHVDEDLADIVREIADIVEDETKHAQKLLSQQRIKIYMPGDFSSVSPKRQEVAIAAFAALMGISPESIEVNGIYQGSIVYDLNMPSEAVQYLRSLLASNDTELHLLAERVMLVNNLGEIEEWIKEEGKFRLVTHPPIKRLVAAIEQGTTSTRCMLFNHAGETVAFDQLEHEQIYPKPGWVEHDPMEIWARTQDVIKGALQKAGASTADIAAIGVTNQRETAVIWDKNTGKPYCNAVVWQDTRTDKICNELAKDDGYDRFRVQVGLPLATYFSGPKVKWLLENVDGLREAAERGDAIFGNTDSWIIWNLTGGPNGGAHVTDVSNASRTMLMDLDGTHWDDNILAIMTIPKSMLPEIHPSSDPKIYGYTLPDGPFGGRIPVCGDLGDQQAAMVGHTCFSPGEAKNTYGTGCFMILNTGTEIVSSKSGLLTTACYKFGDEPTVYALEGSIAITGALVQWLRDNLKLIEKSSDVEELAKTVDDNGGIYFVPAFSGLFAPYWKNDARGTIVGMTRYINRGHFARAALEATAFQTREVLDAMNADSGVPLKALKVDGGMVYNNLLMQFQADVLGVPVIRPKVAETTALGAAYAAGLAVGFWKNTDEIRANWGVDHTWEPSADDTARTKSYKMWKKAVTRTFGWVEHHA